MVPQEVVLLLVVFVLCLVVDLVCLLVGAGSGRPGRRQPPADRGSHFQESLESLPIDFLAFFVVIISSSPRFLLPGRTGPTLPDLLLTPDLGRN